MKKSKPTITEQFEMCRENMTPGLYRLLADELGVSVEGSDVGYYPAEDAWILPERTPKGDVVGLMRRYRDGSKFLVKGSAHGLYYNYNSDSDATDKRYRPGKHNWLRVDDSDYPNKDKGCPVCGRTKYCMVSRDDPADPPAVLCTKERKGSKKWNEKAASYLHILDEARDLCGTCVPVIKFLHPDDPVLVVEGYSDTQAGITLGFDTIGRFSALGGMDMLKQMPITGKDVWIIGENDRKDNGDWPGKEGVDRTYLAMHKHCNVTRVFPPDGVKDLRDWLSRGLTKDEFKKYVATSGDSREDLGDDVLKDDIAANIAERFLDEYHTTDDVMSLKVHRNTWYEWTGNCYEAVIDERLLRGQVQTFLNGKSFIQTDGKGNDKVTPYKANRGKVNDIMDMLNQWCPVKKDPPFWINKPAGMPYVEDCIAFDNGVLDVNAYMEGRVVLHNPDPNLFVLSNCPYDFNEDASSKFTEDYLLETYGGDRKAVDLVWEWVGYVMVPDMSREKFMLIYGAPRAGKGIVTGIIKHTVGAKQTCAGKLDHIVTGFGLSSLLGRLSCIFGDIRNPPRHVLDRALGVVLPIVGQDGMPVDIKHCQALPDVQFMTRFTMAMNELLVLHDHSRAMEARMLTLHHPIGHMDDTDTSIKRRILSDAKDGKMVNYALRGLKRLRDNDAFSVPGSHEVVMKQYRALAEPVASFIEDCCECESDNSIEKHTIYMAWKEWCRQTNNKAGQPHQFGKWLMGHDASITVGRKRDGERRIGTYDGVQLNEWAKAQYLG